FGLLGLDSKIFTIKGEDEEITEGLGGTSQQKDQKFDLVNAVLFNNAPIFSALLGANGKYKVLSAPDTVDLRGANMPPIRNQGQRGTCVLFSTAGILDYMYASKGLPIKS